MTSKRAAEKAAKRRRAYRQTTTPVEPGNRILVLYTLFCVVGIGFLAVLVDMQVIRPDFARSYGRDQWTRQSTIQSYRGAILDRNGEVLASSVPSQQIVADPTLVPDPAVTASMLSPLLGVPEGELVTMLTPDNDQDQYSLLARDLDDQVVERIGDLFHAFSGADDPMRGIILVPEEYRIYPGGDMARSLLGRVDNDERGVSGLEAQYDDLMTGSHGRTRFERGRFGTISVGDTELEPATPGQDINLTIDRRIQYMAERTLVEQCSWARANGATAIVSDPRTGEILAMASVVKGDDGDECEPASYNAALLNSFEPGSVVKPLVIAAVTEERGLTADTLVDVPASLSLGGKKFEDPHPKPAAPYPVSEILADSMNVGTIVTAQQIEATTLYNYLSSFGIGRLTQLGFDGEVRGTLRTVDRWWGADYGSIPIGQGLTTNAAQLLRAYSAIANDGYMRPLTLVSSTVAPDGTVRRAPAVEGTRVISERTSVELTRSLEAVVTEGTGKKAQVPGYRTVGKTGTAWKVFEDPTQPDQLTYGSHGNRRYVVAFAGFFPAENPQLSMVVVVDEPRTATTASAVAAPVFSDVGSYAARILEIPPDSASATGRVKADPTLLRVDSREPEPTRTETENEIG